jgi:hypothetical protein
MTVCFLSLLETWTPSLVTDLPAWFLWMVLINPCLIYLCYPFFKFYVLFWDHSPDRYNATTNFLPLIHFTYLNQVVFKIWFIRSSTAAFIQYSFSHFTNQVPGCWELNCIIYFHHRTTLWKWWRPVVFFVCVCCTSLYPANFYSTHLSKLNNCNDGKSS